MHGEALKVRVAAPPVDGAANAELLRFLAEALGVSRTSVRIVSGETARRKSVLLSGVTVEEVRRKLGLHPLG